jgi:hypothetical protein
MVDDCYFLPDDDVAAQLGDGSAEPLATPQQWAAISFAPVLIDSNKFGAEWEQARGAMARTVISLLRFDDRELARRFMNQPEPLRQAMEMHACLQREIGYLKTHIEALEMASTRLLCVASRCAEQSPL